MDPLCGLLLSRLNYSLLTKNMQTSSVFANMQSKRLMSVKIGDKIPSSLVCIVKYEEGQGYINEIVDTAEYFENKNIVLVGYPGAFTPTCMKQHLPSYIQN